MALTTEYNNITGVMMHSQESDCGEFEKSSPTYARFLAVCQSTGLFRGVSPRSCSDQQSCHRDSRVGFSFLELVSCLAILGLIVGLFLPTLIQLRMTAARARCSDNLRVSSHAILQFESAHGFYPSSVQNSGPQRSWAVMVLPWLGAEEVARLYDYSRHWCEAVNANAVSVQISVFYCPATPRSPRTATGPVKLKFLDGKQIYMSVTAAGCTDYAAIDEVKQDPFIAGETDTRGYGVLKEDQFSRRGEISDGLGNTVMLIESAGRPELWVMGEFISKSSPDTERKHVSSAPWASRSNDFGLDGYSPTNPGLDAGPCAINCTNSNEAYSFHPGGAYAACADGSVRFIRDTVTTRLFARLVTRNGGEAIDWADY